MVSDQRIKKYDAIALIAIRDIRTCSHSVMPPYLCRPRVVGEQVYSESVGKLNGRKPSRGMLFGIMSVTTQIEGCYDIKDKPWVRHHDIREIAGTTR